MAERKEHATEQKSAKPRKARRRLWVTLALLVGAPLALLAFVLAAPSAIGWNWLRAPLAERLGAETGLTAEISGDLQIDGLFPTLDVSLEGFSLRARDAGPDSRPLFAFESARVTARVLDLIEEAPKVERIIIDGPLVDLSGPPPEESSEEPSSDAVDEQATSGQGLDLAALEELQPLLRGVVIGELRVTGGEIRIPTEAERDDLALGELRLTGGRESSDAPLTLWGELYLNGLPSEAFLTIEGLHHLGSDTPSRIEAGLESDLIHAFATGSFLWNDAPQTDLEVQVSTVALGELTRWLRLPVEDGSPGEVTAFLSATATQTQLQVHDFGLTGDNLSLKGAGSLDWPRSVTEINAQGRLQIDELNLDPFLALFPVEEAAPQPYNAFGPLIEAEAVDLSGLRALTADLRLEVGSISYNDEQVGPLVFDASAREGAIDLSLGEFEIAGGRVLGGATLDARGESLIFENNLILDRISLVALADLLGEEEPIALGEASGVLSARSQGADLRSLIGGVTGRLQLDIGGLEVARDVDEGISELKVDLLIPGGDQAPYLLTSFRRDGQRVLLDVETSPLPVIIDRQPARLSVIASSPLGAFDYSGRFLQRPLPGLDGSLKASSNDLAALMAWLGQPLEGNPGAVSLEARFAGDGTNNRIESFTVSGPGLNLSGEGQVTLAEAGSGRFDFTVTGGDLNLTPYLPAAGGESTTAPTAPGMAAPQGLGGWSGQITYSANSLRYDTLSVGSHQVTAGLEGGVVQASVSAQSLAGGDVALEVSAPLESGAGSFSGRIANVDAGILAQLANVDGVSVLGPLSADFEGTLDPRRAFPIVSGRASAALPTFALADLPNREFRGLDLQAALQDGEITLEVPSGAVRGAEMVEQNLQLSARLTPQGALPQGLDAAPFEARGVIGESEFTASGSLPGGGGAFAADLALTTPNLDTLLNLADAQSGLQLPAEVSTRLAMDGALIRVEDLDLKLGSSDLTGAIAYDAGRDRPYIQGALRSQLIDVEELSGKGGEETEADLEETAGADDLVLSDSEIIPVDLLRSFDADLDLTAQRIVIDDAFSTEESEIRLSLANGLLTLNAPRLVTSGGAGKATLTVSAQDEPPAVALLVNLQGIDYGPLLNSMEITDGLHGEMDLEIDLNGRGRSLHQIAASANGFWKAIALDGEVDDDLMGFISFGAGDLLTSFFDSSDTDRMNCFISVFDVNEGVGEMRVQVLDTSRFNVAGDGSIDFQDETLDFTFSPSSTMPSLLSFATPFDVTGKWVDPSIGPSAAGTLLQVGKIAGSIFNPLVGLGILAADTALANRDLCSAALTLAEGDAPPTGTQNGDMPLEPSGAQQ